MHPNSRTNRDVRINININGNIINFVEYIKYLGVIIDSRLSWLSHIDFLYNKLIKYCGIFYKIRDFLPNRCLHTLYYSFIHSNLQYGVELYANASYNKLDKLCKLNNKLIRILFNKPCRTRVSELYCSVKSMPIPMLQDFKLLLFVFKCLRNPSLLPDIFISNFYFSHQCHPYPLKNTYNLFVPRFNTTLGLNSTSYKCCRLWNALPNDIKCINSPSIFKSKLKLYFINKLCDW